MEKQSSFLALLIICSQVIDVYFNENYSAFSVNSCLRND